METVVIAHNIRSTHNVGAIFRNCDGFGVKHLYLTGYTPYPSHRNDARLPHIADKLTKQIHKSALGAEVNVPFSQCDHIDSLLPELRNSGFTIVGLEQHPTSTALPDYVRPKKVALLLGEEVDGISQTLLASCDDIIEIPMFGQKESFNVSVASGIALYALQASANR